MRYLTSILLCAFATVGCDVAAVDPNLVTRLAIAGVGLDDAAAPRYPAAGRSTDLFQNGSSAIDIYLPDTPELQRPIPAIILLQGARVHKSYYSRYCARIAAHGFVVLAANHDSAIGYFTSTSSVFDVLSYVTEALNDPTSRMFGIVDLDRIGVLGHSFGGATALTMVQGDCNFPFCSLAFERPSSIRAVSVYASHLADLSGDVISIDARGLPVQMMIGEFDAIASAGDIRRTYEALRNATKQLIELKGANHFAITDVNNPPGTITDTNDPQVDQDLSINLAADWVGVFMRAHVSNDNDALQYLQTCAAKENDLFGAVYEPFQLQPTLQATASDNNK